MILMIDDCKESVHADIVARTGEAGLMILGALQGNLTELHIDFDLGYRSRLDGCKVLKEAVANEIELPNIIWVISLSPPGRIMITNYLLDIGYTQTGSKFEKEN